MNKILSLLLATFIFGSAMAQTSGLKGRIINRDSRNPISQAKIKLNDQIIQLTTQNGDFTFDGLEPGTYRLIIEAPDYQTTEVTAKVSNNGVTQMSNISLSPILLTKDVDEGSFSEFDTESSNDAQALPTTLSASKDVYNNIASYTFGQMRFRPRGYETSTEAVYMNGIYMNDALTGYSPWSLWGGLNDVTRDQETSGGLNVSDYGLGSINGVTNINTRASMIRKGLRVGMVNANGQYRFRGMVTYGSGEDKDGWSYALSLSTRQGGNDYIEGLYYNTYSYYAAVEKKINSQHRLALTVFGAPTERGVQGSATQEVYDLVGSNYYNTNWGYQGGTGDDAIRNARIRRFHEPVTMLNYFYTINEKTKLQAALSYRTGQNKYSALDWYDAPDPRPDYYRNLPSYFPLDAAKRAELTQAWQTDPSISQVNWQQLYDINNIARFLPSEIDSIGGGVNANTKRSKYIIEDRHTDQNDWNAKVQADYRFSPALTFVGGIDLRWNKTHYFKTVNDLLGGDVWLDVDQFAERDFGSGEAIQNNLLAPNRVVKEGDTYGYSYYAHYKSSKAWGVARSQYKDMESFLAAEIGTTQFYREGLFQKGLFKDNSLGNSEKQNFFTYNIKAGITKKISMYHSISINAALIQNAPYFQDGFVSPRTRNTVAPGLEGDKTTSFDATYNFRFGAIKGRVTGFFTTIENQTKLISFYDDIQRTFVNFSMWNINQLNTGVEMGFQAPLIWNINMKGGLNYGYYVYTNNPYVTETVDNSNTPVEGFENVQVYWKDYNVSGTPQLAGSIGLDYRSRDNLFLSLDASYYDYNYIDMNPLYRTDAAHLNLDEYESQALAHQEKFKAAFLLNASVGKMWSIDRKYTLGVNLNVNNMLNTQSIKTGGYEQMRLKSNERVYQGTTETYYSAFPSKYFYLLGASYYLNMYFRF